MAKQTFTVGQVLTADQMTSLQQTAMGGGSATAKTASYTLVAADAGTTVIMNSASSTTITVNTSLFAAGDTVFIVNQGAGVCTITAGTATVSTAGSLAMSQNETGELYFLSTSAAIFSEYTQSAGTGGMTDIASGSLSGSALSLTSISGSYKDLFLVIRDINLTNAVGVSATFNNDTGSNYLNAGIATQVSSPTRTAIGSQGTNIDLSQTSFATGDNNNSLQLRVFDYANATSGKLGRYQAGFTSNANGKYAIDAGVYYYPTTAITRIDVSISAGTFTGTYVLYGVN